MFPFSSLLLFSTRIFFVQEMKKSEQIAGVDEDEEEE
jgi:hypothetical protein